LLNSVIALILSEAKDLIALSHRFLCYLKLIDLLLKPADWEAEKFM